MKPRTWNLVLLISMAHALVHVYEVSIPSADPQLAEHFFPEDPVAGKRFTGLLSNTWRLPFGFGALIAGWVVDRFGASRMLAIYLLGCSLACGLIAQTPSEAALFLIMFGMGSLASIYHPAGLAMISHHTDAANRPRALGIHGIFGSAGLALAPFLFGSVQQLGLGWQTYFLVLSIPGVALGGYFLTVARDGSTEPIHQSNRQSGPTQTGAASWASFFVLSALAALQGFVYSGFVTFLPRYLNASYGASAVLLLGCLGQYTAGRIARVDRLERQLTLIVLANAPLLAAIAVAQGWQRPVAAGIFAVVHFMYQPIYNSLIAKYTPPHRRSLCYGFSFAMAFGIGSFGSSFAGFSTSQLWTYGILAVLSAAAAGLGLILWRWWSTESGSERTG